MEQNVSVHNPAGEPETAMAIRSMQEKFERVMTSPALSERLSRPAPTPIRKNVQDFIPLRDQVLVRRVVRDEKSENGLIWLPEKGKEKPMEGEVLAAGRGKFDLLGRFIASEVEAGDRVLFGKYDGTEIVLNGEPCLILKEEQIVGLLR